MGSERSSADPLENCRKGVCFGQPCMRDILRNEEPEPVRQTMRRGDTWIVILLASIVSTNWRISRRD
jgi:hypothetical protein